MVYDKHPVFDHFRRVDADTVLGLMDRKGDAWYRERGRRQERFTDAQRMIVEAVALAAEDERGVLDGPHGAEVIGERVVRRVRGGQRAHAPAGEHLREQR